MSWSRVYPLLDTMVAGLPPTEYVTVLVSDTRVHLSPCLSWDSCHSAHIQQERVTVGSGSVVVHIHPDDSESMHWARRLGSSLPAQALAAHKLAGERRQRDVLSPFVPDSLSANLPSLPSPHPLSSHPLSHPLHPPTHAARSHRAERRVSITRARPMNCSEFGTSMAPAAFFVRPYHTTNMCHLYNEALLPMAHLMEAVPPPRGLYYYGVAIVSVACT